MPPSFAAGANGRMKSTNPIEQKKDCQLLEVDTDRNAEPEYCATIAFRFAPNCNTGTGERARTFG